MPLVNTSLTVKASGLQTSALDLLTGQAALDYTAAVPLGSGAGGGQADRMFTDTRTLAASASEDLDLAGVLVDPFGATLTFARVKGLIIAASSANTNNVIVGGAASNGFITPFGSATDKVNVRPGGVFALVAPDATAYAVTPATADLLHITNGGAGTPVTYDVIVIGASA